MQLADYFVGKPGPGTISEALVMGLPGVRRAQLLDDGAGTVQYRLDRGKSARRGP